MSLSPRLAAPRRAILAVAAVVAVALAALAGPVAAHPELAEASPPPDGLLAAPPRAVELWLTEAVDEGAGSPAIQVLASDGTEMEVTNLRLDPESAQHVIADVDGLTGGTYTVLWTARSAVDGHTLSGSYGFRVGTGRAPGAATVEGENPRAWAVATRWLTFLGAAVAAAGFLFRPVLLAGESDGRGRRRAVAVLIGAAVATLATLAEPLFQTWFPPEGAITPTLSEALSGMPNAWWLRLGAALAALMLAIVYLVGARRGARWLPVEGIGAGLALGTLLGLSFTSHAAARESWRELAVAADVLHQWSVALWVGGLAHLALSWPRRPAPPAAEDETAVAVPVSPVHPVRRFSALALGLVVVGAATGVLNAGLVLPAVEELWESTYGRILIIKILVLVPVLLLATFHRVRLRQTAAQVGHALRSTVRLEAALILLVVLGGSVLALLAPPAKARPTTAEVVSLAGPLVRDGQPQPLDVRLDVAPAAPGENDVTVTVLDQTDAPLPADQIALVRLDFLSLDHQAAQNDIDATPDGNGGFTVAGTKLSLDGWWRIDVLVRQLGAPDGATTFYLMIPDPNVNGMDAPETPDTNPEAQAHFEQGLAQMMAASQVRYWQHLSGGTGVYAESDHLVDVGGEQAASALYSQGFEVITIGETQWIRRAGEEWTERAASPVIPPSQWGAEYEGATGFRLGVTEEIGGETAQMISFVVPAAPQRAVAWYAWWVGTESGQVLREAMVSRSHYMVNAFTSYNEPLGIEPPNLAAEG